MYEKIIKISEFYMIFARKSLHFHDICPKIVSHGGGARAPLCVPRLLHLLVPLHTPDKSGIRYCSVGHCRPTYNVYTVLFDNSVTDVIVCQTERFEASCERSDEVIVMTSAQYGRMRVSRCVQSDYGYIGCSADVLGVADSVCSGRRRCSMGVPSTALEAAAAVSCPGDLKSYLAASYRCVKGETTHRVVIKR